MRILIVLAVAIIAGPIAVAQPTTFGISTGIESTRPMTDESLNAVFFSPSGVRYALLLIRGDVHRDGVWAELIVGGTGSLEEAAPKTVAQFFTRGLGAPDTLNGELIGSPLLTAPSANVPKWIDDRTMALRWEDEDGISQVVAVDVTTGARRFLTAEKKHVMSFAVGPRGAMAYDTWRGYSSEAVERTRLDGFAVESTQATALLAALSNEAAKDNGMCDRTILKSLPTLSKPTRVHGAQIFCQLSFLLYLGVDSGRLFSPDGNRVILNVETVHAPDEWKAYAHPELQNALRQHASNPHYLTARLITHLAVLDVASGSVRRLWNAPYFSTQAPPLPHVAWSPDSRTIVTGPAFLPIDETMSDTGLRGLAVAEVDIETGSYTQLPLDSKSAREIRSLEFSSATKVDVTLASGGRLSFRKDRGQWLPASDSEASRPASRMKQSRVRVELRQDMNTPPWLFGVDRESLVNKMLLDLNPSIRKSLLRTKVDITHWATPSGQEWSGRLYYPADHSAGGRHPLVIQTHGYAPREQFSIYGSGDIDGVALGPGWSVYLATALANAGIAVLQVGGPDAAGEAEEKVKMSGGRISRYDRFVEGMETAVMRLAKDGLVDATRVGIMGHSATGRVVEYALIASNLRYAAAIASDHADSNYLQAALYGWPVDSANGAAPFGVGLRDWLENSPAFNVERIQTPLQIIPMSSTLGSTNLLWGWEMFSRLRALEKPVEYYVIPDIRRGSHILQNPRQLLAAQSRALDWWRFWLLGEEDGDLGKLAQYDIWKRLRVQHNADIARPREPRYSWTRSVAAGRGTE